MLEDIRNIAGTWMVKVILGAIVLTFVVYSYGSGGKFGKYGDGDFAAVVNGRDISLQTFEREFRNREQQQRQNGKMLPSELNEKYIKQQTMDSLIESELLMEYADEAGIVIPNEAVSDEIKGQQYFQDETTHTFIGRERYVAKLKDADLDPADYERDVARSLRLQKTREFIDAATKVSPTEIKDEFHKRNEKANLSFLRIDPVTLAAASKGPAVSGADIDAWVKAHAGKVESIYAERKDTAYTTPARAELWQITLRKPAASSKNRDEEMTSAKRRAERALEQARTDFVKASGEYAEGAPWEKSGSPREFSRRELPAAVADVVFSMKPEDPPAIVETPTAFEIIKLKQIAPEKVTELDEALKKSIVEEQVRTERAAAEVESFAKEALARIQKGEALDKIAASKKLQVKETGAFPKRDEIPGIPEATPDLAAAAFKLAKPGDVLLKDGALPKAGSGYVLAVLKQHDVANEADFDKQKGFITYSLKREKSAAAFAAWKADRLAHSKIVTNPILMPPAS